MDKKVKASLSLTEKEWKAIVGGLHCASSEATKDSVRKFNQDLAKDVKDQLSEQGLNIQ